MFLLSGVSGRISGRETCITNIGKDRIDKLYEKAIQKFRHHARTTRDPAAELTLEIPLTDDEKWDFALLIQSSYRLIEDKSTRKRVKFLLLKYESILNYKTSDAFHGQSHFRVPYGILSPDAEHILPQKPNKTGNSKKWLDLWSDEDRESRVHQLGNIALLEDDKNRAAKNSCYSIKRGYYFGTSRKENEKEQCTSDWTMIQELKQYEHNGEWLVKSVDDRDEKIKDTLLKYFGLERHKRNDIKIDEPWTVEQITEAIHRSGLVTKKRKRQSDSG